MFVGAEVVQRKVGTGRIAQRAHPKAADDAAIPDYASSSPTLFGAAVAAAAAATVMRMPMVDMVMRLLLLLAMVMGRVHGASFPGRKAQNGAHDE